MKYLLLYFFAVFITVTAFPQEMSQLRVVGKGEYRPDELIDYDVKDANGDVAAGLIIETDLVGLAYDANLGMVKMNHSPGRDFLFLQYKERELKILLSGYAPLQVILKKYGITLEKGRSWLLKITADKKSELIPVTFLVQPAGAEIFIDGKSKGQVESCPLGTGEHELQVVKPGYETVIQKITVSVESAMYKFTLKEVQDEKVFIASTPKGAKIEIDREIKGETDREVFVPSGLHKLSLIKADYIRLDTTLSVTAGGNNKYSFELLKYVATLNLAVIPEDAEILLNGRKVNSKSLELEPGNYNIEVIKEKYLSEHGSFSLKSGEVLNKEFRLEKNTGIVNHSVIPSDAEILINGTRYKTREFELSPGKYKLTLRAQGYREKSEMISVERGKRTELKTSLDLIAGKLEITMNVPEAQCELYKNGKLIERWTGSKQFAKLQIGEYEVVIKAKGYKTSREKVSIAELEKTAKSIELKVGSDVPDNMVFVEGGTFQMGNAKVKWYDFSNNKGLEDAVLIHTVTLNDFYIGKYELTQKEWESVMGSNPSNFKGDNRPVENVSWNDVQGYINKLIAKTGNRYRLPTEAEWEYAARGGNKTKGYRYCGSNSIDEVAWYGGNSNAETHEVGQKQPNELGLYDMSGNVWEWCSDWYDENYYKNSQSNNPQGPNSGEYHVFRGGSLGNLEIKCRSSLRNNNSSNYRNLNLGFRLVQEPK